MSAPLFVSRHCRGLRSFAIIMALFALCFVTASFIEDSDAESFYGPNGLQYTTTSETEVSVAAGTSSGDVVIPSSIEHESKTYSVTSIGTMSFYGSSITAISIPNSIETIGVFAFYGAELSTVSIPGNVETIDYGAFMDCKSLCSVTIDEGVKTLGDLAFSLCVSLTSVEVPDSITSIGEKSFQMCTSLKTVTLGDSVKTIGNDAFQSCRSLESINLPEGLISIGDTAFYSCRSLTSISVPSTVTSLGDDFLSWCTSISSLTVAEDNINYSSLDNVLFNKEKTELIQCAPCKTGDYNVPNTVQKIMDGAFHSSKLTSVFIPSSVTQIGDYFYYSVFFICENLTSVSVDNDNINYSSVDGVLFNKDGTELLYYPSGRTGTYTIPEKVTSTLNYAFNYTKLTSVIMSPNMSVIEDHLFYHGSLTSVTIPTNVTSIESNAFHSCSSLEKIIIHNNVSSIGSGAFYLGSEDSPVTCDVYGCTSGMLDSYKSKYTTFTYKGLNVTYLLDGKTYGETDTPYFGSEVTVRDKASIPGYTTTEWTSSDVTFNDGKFIMPGNDVTISATSKIIVYKVSYDVNGGSGSVSSDDIVGEDVLKEYVLKEYHGWKTGYVFDGWSDGINTYAPGTAVSITKDVTYTAVWTDRNAGISNATIVAIIIGVAAFILADIVILAIIFYRNKSHRY